MSTTYNTKMDTILGSISAQVQKLFSADRNKTKGIYVELDPSQDRSTPHFAADGSIIYTEYHGIMRISAPNLANMLTVYDECVSALQSYGFMILDIEDSERKNRYIREVSVKVLSC